MLTSVYIWPVQLSVISLAAVIVLDICEARSAESSALTSSSDRRNYGKATFSPLRSAEIQPQATLPDLNLNACLHLCHRNNLEWFGRVD